MLLMVEKGIRGRICHAIYRYARANNKYMEYYDKNEEPSYIKYWGINNLYGLAIPQKMPIDGFKLVDEISQFNEDYIENYNEDGKRER